MTAACYGMKGKTRSRLFARDNLPICDARFAMFPAHHLARPIGPIRDKRLINPTALAVYVTRDTGDIGLGGMSPFKL
ncbi:hypothetical protein GCM10011309_01570 [Litorimonas cladophorae]|uniref:Uncharacterized protein n=1 Tax=Litorimonas cladophorae TaxID=1220491 RepID=A0A918KA01_9PROT|nr:hypothetical protein GCM10011309_01570 [Litorimonas cladophorae]